MRVTAGGLAWEVDGPVEIGDRLKLPGTPFIAPSGSWEAKVTALDDGGYKGYCKKALENLGQPKPLPPHVREAAQRILDRAAARLVEEQSE